MLLFIITQAISDDDGNFYSGVHKVCRTEQEALEELDNLHTKVLSYFENPDDCYDKGDWSFDICEEDDIEVRNYATIEKVDVTSTYYVQVEDGQNNVETVVKVKADSKEDARYKALRALHVDENLYIVTKEEAIRTVEEEGIYAIDKDGCEIDLEEDE